MEILIEIRRIDKTLPVIILTSLEDEKLAGEFLANGAVKYIPKNDYFIDALMEAINQHFA